MEPSEKTIWKNIQQQHLESFELYYKEHYKKFLVLAYKYTRDYEEAEEIVNDIFLKLWMDGKKLSISSSLKSYIYKSIVNKSINFLNKQKRELLIPLNWNSLPDHTYEVRQIEELELKEKIYSAIDHLPVQCRKVFELSRFSGLKQHEIAKILGISIKTVKNHITLALKHLNNLIIN